MQQKGYPQHQQHVIRTGGGGGPVRNPWVDRHPDSSSSSASRSARSLRRPQGPLGSIRSHTVRPVQALGPPPAAEWLRPPAPQRLRGPQMNQLGVLNQKVVVSAVGGAPSICSSQPDSAAGYGVGSGSSNCSKYDSFCYHCLQVVYIAGILTGISLVIAGSVLRGSPRRGDLLVLVYIGVLLAAVCVLLLSVHYCVRKGVKERKRALRAPRFPVHAASDATELQQLQQPRHPHDYNDVRIDTGLTEPRHHSGDFGDLHHDTADIAIRHHQRDFDEIRQYPSEYGDIRHHPLSLMEPRYSNDFGSNRPGDFARAELGDVRRSGRSRSSHSSHGRRYFVQEHPDEWERERLPHQPLVHRPRQRQEHTHSMGGMGNDDHGSKRMEWH